MGETGIVRRVDDLGRIVLPMEMRRTLGIGVKDPLSITIEDDRIVLQKHRDACALCGSTDDVVKVRDRVLCPSCVATVKRL
jgi:transcriptional pleiotropic regulator of transition state genes